MARFRVKTQATLLALCIFSSLFCFASTSKAKGSSNTEAEYWDLSDLYESEKAWETAFDEARTNITQLETLRGSLGKNANSMYVSLQTMSDTMKDVARLYVYASLNTDEDQRKAEQQERFARVQILLSEYGKNTAWLSPEILNIGEKKVRRFIKKEPQLQKFAFQLEDTLRQAPYTLDASGEALLAQASLMMSNPGQIYEMYANASIPWPEIALSTGKTVKLNQSGYSKYRGAENREDRKKVFDTFWSRWQDYSNGMGATLNAEVQANVFAAKARGFNGALQQNLFNDSLPPEIYETLVSQVNSALPTFHRYLKLRGRMLGIDDLRYYDIYPPLVEAKLGRFKLDRAKEIALEALKPFGDEYLGLLKQGIESSWTHSHPQDGKRSGAYMNGWAYDVHPYVLLNHNDDYNSVSTFAHEWGHAVHTMLSVKNNDFDNSDYSTFIAEMAATINEILLEEYMIENAKTDTEKLYYLGHALESIRGTVFRQTMFAEFEKEIHETAENGEALTGATLSKKYLNLLRKYHGESLGVLTVDDTYGVEWAYIPHFYYDFYVFQYATSQSGAVWFADQFLNGDDSIKDAFIRVLKAGGSDYPHNILLNEAGLDMRKPDAYQAAFSRMTNLMNRIEEILNKHSK